MFWSDSDRWDFLADAESRIARSEVKELRALVNAARMLPDWHTKLSRNRTADQDSYVPQAIRILEMAVRLVKGARQYEDGIRKRAKSVLDVMERSKIVVSEDDALMLGEAQKIEGKLTQIITLLESVKKYCKDALDGKRRIDVGVVHDKGVSKAWMEIKGIIRETAYLIHLEMLLEQRRL
ncbi:hypothetical protein HYU16_03025 [Candidatus Woesearchaeota archaeon]|nr:hypothetical protein [Candidatus Woesearchaeota archaeon]